MQCRSEEVFHALHRVGRKSYLSPRAYFEGAATCSNFSDAKPQSFRDGLKHTQIIDAIRSPGGETGTNKPLYLHPELAE